MPNFFPVTIGQQILLEPRPGSPTGVDRYLDPIESDGVATVAATAARTRPLAGTISAAAAVTASIVRDRRVSPTPAGVATVSGAIVRTRARTPAAAGAATVTATLNFVRALTAMASGAAAVSGQLAGPVPPETAPPGGTAIYVSPTRYPHVRVRKQPQLDAHAAGYASVSCELTKTDQLDRDIEQLLTLELLPA